MADMNTTATVVTRVNGEQAENELKKLQTEARELRLAIAKAYTAGDTKNLRVLEKALKENQRAARALQASMFDVNKVLANLKTSSVKDLQKALKMVTMELNSGKIARGSKEWDEYIKKIQLLRGELNSIQAQQRSSSSLWGRMANGINKYAGVAATGIAAITGITMSLNRMNEAARLKEDKAANLKALTGLDDESIGWLTTQANELSSHMQENGVRIRKSATEILDAYRLVGSAKPPLLKNKEALNEVTKQTMILAEASGMDLLEAVDGVTLAMNQFSAEADQAGRFANVMAAGAQAGSAEVASVTESLRKSGVVLSQSNISIEESVGLIQTLSEFGIKDQIAGTGMKTFFLKLAGGADETNPKVVGLSKALENLSKQNMSASEMMDKFGLEAYNVASILINNTDKVEHYTKAVTDTNQAVDQAAINSATTQAKLAQMKNEMQEAGIAIAKELQPAMLHLGSTFSRIVKTLTAVIRVFKEYGPVLLATGASITAYTAIVNAAQIKTALLEFWNKKLVVSFGKVKKAMSSNIWGIAITALTTIGALVYKWYKNYDKLDNTISKMNERLIQEKKNIQSLFTPLKDNNVSIDEKRKLIKKINEQYGEYLPKLLTEKSSIEEIDIAYKSLLSTMREKILLETKESAMTETTKKMVEDQAKALDRLRGALTDAFGEDAPEVEEWIGKIVDKIDSAKDPVQALHGTTAMYLEILKDIKKEKPNWDFWNPIDNVTLGNSIGDYARAAVTAKKEIDNINKKFNPLLNTSSEISTTSTTVTQEEIITTQATSSEDDPYSRELEIIKKNLIHRSNILAEARNNELMSDAEFAEGIKALTLESMQETLNLTKKYYGEDSLEYEEALQQKLTAENEFNNIIQKCYDDEAKAKRQKEEDLQKALNELRKKYGVEDTQALMSAELAQLDSFYQQKLIQEEEYQQLRQAIIDKYTAVDNSGNLFPNGIFGGEDNQQKILNEAFEQFNNITSAISNLWNAQQQEEMAAIDKKYQHEIELAGNNQGAITAIEKKKEAEKAKVQSEYADRQFGIQITQALSSAAMSIIQCFAQLGPIAGAIAAIGVGATTALQIAAMNKQRQAAKQFWTGGYTPDGRWDEYQGNVHSNEFVANRFAVNNPNVRPVLDMIDAAQRNNTIATMSKQDVSNSLNSAGITTANAITSIHTAPSSNKLASASEKLAEVLNKGIHSYVTIEGPNGFEETYNKYQQMQRNKSL